MTPAGVFGGFGFSLLVVGDRKRARMCQVAPSEAPKKSGAFGFLRSKKPKPRGTRGEPDFLAVARRRRA